MLYGDRKETVAKRNCVRKQALYNLTVIDCRRGVENRCTSLSSVSREQEELPLE